MNSKPHRIKKQKVQIKKIDVVKKIDHSSSASVLPKALSHESADSGKKYLSLLIEGKKSAKEEIFCHFVAKGECENKLGLNKTPLILIFATDLNGDHELIKRDLLFKILEGLIVTNSKVIVIDTEQPSDLKDLGEISKMFDKQVIWYNPKSDQSGKIREEKEIDRLLLAADMALMFNHHLELIQLLMNYGVIILGDDDSPLLENYNPNKETGNSFTFKHKDAWGIFATLIRALETFKFPYDWQNIVRKTYK